MNQQNYVDLARLLQKTKPIRFNSTAQISANACFNKVLAVLGSFFKVNDPNFNDKKFYQAIFSKTKTELDIIMESFKEH